MKVIDAILLEMQLNSATFHKGLKDARAAGKKAKEESVSNLSDIEKAAAGATKAFQDLALKVAAFFAGVLAVNRLEEFTKQLTQTDATLGRTARAIGLAPGTLSIWEGMGERLGVAASSTAAAFANIADIIARAKLGERPAQLDMMRRMQAEGGVLLGDITNTPQFLKALIANARVIAKKDPARAGAMMREAGFPADFVQNVVLSTRSIDDMLAEQARIGKTTQADADAAQALISSIVGLQQAVQQIGRDIMTKLSPAVDVVLDKWRGWITANREWIEQKITEKAKEWWGYFASINWESVSNGITGFIDKANEAAAAMGGWVKLTEVLFALWIGGKFIQLMGSISAIYMALTGGVAIGSGGLLAAIVAFLIAGGLMKKFFAGPEKTEKDFYKPGGGALTSHQKEVLASHTGSQTPSLPHTGTTPNQNERDAITGARTQTPGGPGNNATPGSVPDIPLSGGAASREDSLTGMQPEFRDRLARIMKDAPPGASVFSGYRSEKLQAELFSHSDKSGHMVARPGHSHHGKGDAADIKGDMEWFHKHAHEYGLYFPMPYESWHIQLDPNTKSSTQHPAAHAAAGAGHNRLMHRHTKIEHHVDNMTIHSRATDAHGVANDMRLALRERFGSVA